MYGAHNNNYSGDSSGTSGMSFLRGIPLYYNTIFLFQNLQIILISVCATEPPLVFESLTNAIIFILFLFLLVLALLNASRSVSSSIFRRQGLATYKVVVLVILPSPIFFLGRLALIFSDRGIQYRALIWLEFCWITVLPIIILVVLFAPIVSLFIYV